MTLEDRIRQKAIIEQASRSTVRSHPGAEPSDPPPSEKGFRSAAAHAAHGAERLSKRVAALLALVGSAMTMGSVAFAYWNANANDARDNRDAKERAEMRTAISNIDRKVEIITLSVGPLSPKLVELDTKVVLEGNRATALETWAKLHGFR